MLPAVPSVGIIANPAAGKDIRRLVAHASTVDNPDQVNVVRRLLLGLEAAVVGEVLFMPDAFGSVSRALRHLDGAPATRPLELEAAFDASDSTCVASCCANAASRASSPWVATVRIGRLPKAVARYHWWPSPRVPITSFRGSWRGPSPGWRQAPSRAGGSTWRAWPVIGESGDPVLAPIAPGPLTEVPVTTHRKLRVGDVVDVDPTAGVLALDGEREVPVRAGPHMQVRLSDHGPRVVDVPVAPRQAVEAGLFRGEREAARHSRHVLVG
jgi:hypothetical protein